MENKKHKDFYWKFTTVPHKTNQNNPVGRHIAQSSKPEESFQTQCHFQQLPLRSQKSWKKKKKKRAEE